MPFLYNDSKLKLLRKTLRRNSPNAEGILWYYLRDRRFHGLKFRHQYGIGRYVVDFYCPQLRTVIEVDGDSHFFPGARESDKQRESFLEAQNITIIRFLNSDIYENIDGVLEKLEMLLIPPQGHSSFPPPIDRRGEGR